MRFRGVRHVAAPVARVWEALHDPGVLQSVIPGCEGLEPSSADAYAAVLSARVGPIADTYRGMFAIEDLRHGQRLRVSMAGRGRCGRLDIDLLVALEEGLGSHSTALTYDASAQVGGLVTRLGTATLQVAGGHLTGCFFRDLDRSLTASRTRGARATTFA